MPVIIYNSGHSLAAVSSVELRKNMLEINPKFWICCQIQNFGLISNIFFLQTELQWTPPLPTADGPPTSNKEIFQLYQSNAYHTIRSHVVNEYFTIQHLAVVLISFIYYMDFNKMMIFFSDSAHLIKYWKCLICFLATIWYSCNTDVYIIAILYWYIHAHYCLDVCIKTYFRTIYYFELILIYTTFYLIYST